MALELSELVILLAALLFEYPASVEIVPGGLEEWSSCLNRKSDTDLDITSPTPDFPFLRFRKNLGIPLKVLYKLYLVASQMFNGTGRRVPGLTEAYSSVVLLGNPAHRTVLNYRKRLILCGEISLEMELQFTELLLQASDEGAKEAILWDHRRWILKLLHPGHQINREGVACSPHAAHVTPFLVDMAREFSIIHIACEKQPRNYHGWAHWISIVRAIRDRITSDESFGHPLSDLLLSEYKTLRGWVDVHVSDYSAMHCLCLLSELLYELNEERQLNGFIDKQSLAAHATGLILSYPGHEALWCYLRCTFSLVSEQERQLIVNQIMTSESLVSDSLFFNKLVVLHSSSNFV